MNAKRFGIAGLVVLILGMATMLWADVRTSKVATNPTIFQVYDLDGGQYVTVGAMTPANTPAYDIGAGSGVDVSVTDPQWSVSGAGAAAFSTVTVGGTAITAATRFTIYGAGTKYALTNTAAAIDLGTTDPVITITTAGVYHILGRAKLTYTGATVVAETATIKLRRTNNTAADLTGASEVIDLPVATTLTHDWGWVPFDVYYTTANTDDAVTIFGNVSATLGAGTIDVNSCSITAQRVQ